LKRARTGGIAGLLVWTLACAVSAASPALTPLDSYLDGLRTLRTEFSQTVTDGKGEEVQKADGKLTIVRPGKFRWELTPAGNPSAQLMVADGKNLWFYDRDLEQVSVKPATVLTATPASLLSGAGDVRALFTVSAAGKRDGLDWVRVVPKTADADFREAQLAFTRGELRRMVLKDKLGQTVKLEFLTHARNVPVPDAEVQFTPPPGADLIGTPVP
jgi:outer membrane lipoprotein carrier protein